jgi:hypothetical protein
MKETMVNKKDEPVNVTITFTEQQMELVHKLAKEMETTPAKAVTIAVEEFVRKEGGRYTA